MSTWCILLSGGNGLRMGTQSNKTLISLLGEPALCRALRTLRRHADGIILVIRPQDEDETRTALNDAQLTVDGVAYGGADRQESVRNGLSLLPEDCDIVLVHDGARPLVDDQTIENVLSSVRKYGSGVAATPVTDTIKRVGADDIVADTPPRGQLRAVQTPQTFEAGLIRRAHAAYALGERATDDAALAERMGVKVRLTEGDVENIKLTTPEDMLLARQVILKREGQKEEKPMMRIGHGYDVHRLVENRKLILCGVEIPYALGLLGHSDADVALHALMDALLGAAALGDIGRHFPDTDPAYKGADSGKLLDHVVALLEEKGYTVGNVDVTIICQRPKLKDYIEQMRENVARHLKVDIDCVNIKATTTEKLGFEGEGLGISSHAVACIEKA